MPDFKELARMKVTPLVFLGFMLFLMAMSGLAAGVGYFVHHLRHNAQQSHPA